MSLGVDESQSLRIGELTNREVGEQGSIGS
jgi:hypothetical protein